MLHHLSVFGGISNTLLFMGFYLHIGLRPGKRFKALVILGVRYKVLYADKSFMFVALSLFNLSKVVSREHGLGSSKPN